MCRFKSIAAQKYARNPSALHIAGRFFLVAKVNVVDAVDDELTGSMEGGCKPAIFYATKDTRRVGTRPTLYPAAFQEKTCVQNISIVYFFDYLNACLCPV